MEFKEKSNCIKDSVYIDGGIIGTHIVPEESVELRPGGDGIHVQGVEPCLLQCPELPPDLGFGGPVTHFCIPEEWLKVIRKPDGSWKKIVLYNTSVGALLQHDEKMLEKMRDVLRVFEENKNEVALLWRPHPLIQATIESMRPQLWEGYSRIVERYKDAGWGIYDDTADMDRAVALSDGYYGDSSSLVQLYKRTGKPIMLQDPELLDGNDTDEPAGI